MRPFPETKLSVSTETFSTQRLSAFKCWIASTLVASRPRDDEVVASNRFSRSA